ncbi:hypothetical protein Vi05172_g12393 [Venturia inaequalis]|nr:hypothetical protein Vi05172_g12393 [Venturia inaequalis]
MSTTPPNPPPITLTATHHHFESPTDNTDQGSESPGKRRKMSHQSADEEETHEDHLDTTSVLNDAVMGSDNNDNPLEPTLVSEDPVSEEPGYIIINDDEYDSTSVFGDDAEDIHVSTSTGSPVSGKTTDSKEEVDEILTAEPEAPGVYLADRLPPWTQPRKLTRSMSIDSHERFQLEPEMRLWESLKQVISHRRKWWNDRPAPVMNSDHDLVQDASSRMDWHQDHVMIQDCADRVLDAVPYFKRQAEIEGNTRPDALYKTAICIDQKRGLKFKLEEMLNLVAGSNDSWLTDPLMEVIVHLEAPADRLRAKGSRAWFCTDPMIQTWCAAIDPEIHRTKVEMEEMISEERKISCLPAREIPPDASAIVFFTNRSDCHWKTVHAYVRTDNTGVISIRNSMGDSFQYGSVADGHRGDDLDCLRRLMICIAKDSPNPRFRDADWAGSWVGNEDCPQQYGTNDCGVFAANAAIWLLYCGDVHPGSHTSYSFRRHQGNSLRRHYTYMLKYFLDMAMVSSETGPEMVRNGGRRWSVSGVRTDNGFGI